MEFTATINERIDTFNARLDEVEKDLPAVPKAALRLNRAVTERVLDGSGRVGTVVIETATELAENFSEVANKTYKSIVKTAPVDVENIVQNATKFAEDTFGPAFDKAEKFAGETVEYAATGVKQVAGQFGIEFDKVEAAAKETNAKVAKSVTKAAKKVEASETKAEKASLAKKTKAELYEMAKDLDVDGRATMSKGELVKAIAKLV